MAAKPRIVLVGGGSGGHFYPLMSLAHALRNASTQSELYYMGPDPYDKEALDALTISFVACPSGKQRRYTSLQNFVDLFKTFFGCITAIIKLYVLYPDVIVSKGSYTSVPVILAGAFLRIPIVVHESDTRPGRANALAAKFTRHIAISFEEVAPFFPSHDVVLTGIPIRPELLIPPNTAHIAELGLDSALPTLLFLGGSQGAERINKLVLDALDELLPSYNIIHQTGSIHFDLTVLSARELIADDALLSRYHPAPFFKDPAVLNTAYHAASLIVARAGTGSIYEIAIHGKPAILIPIPESVSHDQRTNAYTYARHGAATVIEEHNLTDSLLTSEIDRMIKNPAAYREMSEKAAQIFPRNGAETLAQITLDVTRTHR